ncbi:hypothetical protein DPV83_08580 [Aggregatibacter segnis]|uniref:Pyridoxine 5'-phosphate oxidase dimerisation C-terminal domain-containing protein n=1 Tax=Aggregatibacter segnis TaxID=739 RepID=A0A8B2U4V3_9PAST|nr:pyridoxine 5'-phosphate oxidase C-terminal domain-containing protein [Aggregatibacter segnis]RDE70233.1 hypothetical protein DPV83_08580 [Aggregatibacter segnis]
MPGLPTKHFKSDLVIGFWQRRLNFLHDRICYWLQNEEWQKARLPP